MSNASFLPEDYLDQRAERRTNLISLTLFAIVMIAVFTAFLVTNRQWSQIKSAQRAINDEYAEAASHIDRLNDLEMQKKGMMSKAELAAALVERVPRSILLAGLINRMPKGLGLLEFELKSDRVRVKQATPTNQPRNLARRRRARNPVVDEKPKVEVPKYHVKLRLVGIAPTDEEVSRYIAQLNNFELLKNVQLQYTEERLVNDSRMRQFEVEMELDPEKDVRTQSQTINPGGRAQLSDDGAGPLASGWNRERGG
jgi:Tfp pilus assembly protein PilN